MSNTMKATIKIAKAEDKGKTVKLFAEDNKTWFSLWKTKPDGSPSPTFETFQQLGFAPTVEIEYVEKEKSFVGKEGNSVPYVERTVWGIKPSTGATTPVVSIKPATGANNASGRVSSTGSGVIEFEKPRNFDREAYEKCCSIWASAHFGKTEDSDKFLEGLEKGVFWKVFQAIRKDGEQRFNPINPVKAVELMREMNEPSDDVPPPTDEFEGVNVADIPF